jgi:hypothetical protein
VRRVLALVVVLSGLCVAPPAAAQIVTLRDFPGAYLTQGPQLVGERVAWSQSLCVRGCDIDFSSQIDELYEIRSAGADGRVSRIFRTRTRGSFSGPNFGYDHYSFLLSEQTLATVRHQLSGDEVSGESGGVSLRAGAPQARRELLARCLAAPAFDAMTPLALDASRVVFDPAPCDAVPRFVLRDLATGATRPLPDAAGRVREVRLRGGFVAWVESTGVIERLVVHDLTAGTTAYSAPLAGVVEFELDSDGSVALVAGDPRSPCRTGRLLRYSLSAPVPTDLGPACATGVRIDAGRIVFLGWEQFTRTLRVVAPDGAVQDLVRFGRVRPGAFDLDGERLAWATRDCGGGQAIFTAELSEAPLTAGSINCRARFRSGTVPVRRGLATVKLTCPRGCGGELSLRHLGRRDFSLLRGEREVRVRLSRRARERLQRRGSLQALAKIVTRNRAGDRHARSRAVTLVAR